MIVTANLYYAYATPPMPSWELWWNHMVVPNMRRNGVEPRVAIADSPMPIAFVAQGRWVAHCTNPNCSGGFERIWEEGLYMCLSCFNSHVGYAVLSTVFPEARKAIEAVLEPRELLNRNWLTSESVAALSAENVAHGLEAAWPG